MTPSQEPPSASAQPDPASPATDRRSRTAQLLAEWWPVLYAAAAATTLATFIYAASVLMFIQSRLDLAFGFAFFGLFINAFPPTLVWVCAKWTK